MISRFAEDDLRRAAEATGGRYARWDRAQDLAAMREAVASLPVRTLAERTGTERADRFQWLLAPAVVLLIAEMLLGGFGRSGGLAARVIPRERSDRGILRGNGSRYARARSLASLGMTYVWLGLTALGIGSCTATWRGERHYARGRVSRGLRGLFQRSGEGQLLEVAVQHRRCPLPARALRGRSQCVPSRREGSDDSGRAAPGAVQPGQRDGPRGGRKAR